MRISRLALTIVLMAVPVPAVAAAQCDLATVRDMGELVQTLGRRAVALIRRAGGTNWQADAQLARLVADDAAFALGSGDVGQPLGKGPAGARAMAERMAADGYRLMLWGGIPMKVDGCEDRETELMVEFSARERSVVFPVTFRFLKGRVVGATGWTRPVELAPMAPVQR